MDYRLIIILKLILILILIKHHFSNFKIILNIKRIRLVRDLRHNLLYGKF